MTNTLKTPTSIKSYTDNSKHEHSLQTTADKHLSQWGADADRQKLVRRDAANMQDMNQLGSQDQELFR